MIPKTEAHAFRNWIQTGRCMGRKSDECGVSDFSSCGSAGVMLTRVVVYVAYLMRT